MKLNPGDYERILKMPVLNIRRLREEVLRRSVLPGDAHVTAQTGWVPQDWEDPFAEPEEDRVPTLPTAFPAAPAAPEICKLSYYGIRCDITGCQDEVHLRKRNV